MHSSITCGLFLSVTMLFSLPVQGQPQPNKTVAFHNWINPTCCHTVSTAPILKPIKKCFEQKDTLLPCKLHAYIFITDDDQAYCVDPSAKWLPARLEKLKEKGILCCPLAQANRDDDDAL